MGKGFSAFSLIAVLLLSSCYQLPASWPIASLSLPRGAHLVEPVLDKASLYPDAAPAWEAYFNYSGSLDDVALHIENCLAELQYFEYSFSRREYDSRDTQRRYYSPDFLTEVRVTPGFDANSAYDSDYCMTITLHPEVPSILIDEKPFYDQSLRPLGDDRSLPPSLPHR